MTELLEPYRYGPIQFTLTNDAYERHLLFDNVVDLAMVGPREHYEICIIASGHLTVSPLCHNIWTANVLESFFGATTFCSFT